MKKQIVTALVAIGAVGFGAAVYGHHNRAAFFLEDETTRIEGVVTEFWFANPHARIYLDVTLENGEVQEWMAEGSSRNVLIRREWSEDTIKPGMELIISGDRSRDGSNSLSWGGSLTTADGAEVGP